MFLQLFFFIKKSIMAFNPQSASLSSIDGLSFGIMAITNRTAPFLDFVMGSSFLKNMAQKLEVNRGQFN